MDKKYLIIDFDSTFIKVESLDELAKISLDQNLNKDKITKEIEILTNLGMMGHITFEDSLQKRLQLFQPHKNHLSELKENLKKHITESFLRNQDFINKNAENIYIVSGGFKEYIVPIVKEFGISENHVLANDFIFDDYGNFKGINTNNHLAKNNGKVSAIESLKLNGEVIVVGDGMTDYQIKEYGLAKLFIAFNENVARETVNEKADKVVSTFDDVVGIFEVTKPKALLLENIEKTAVKYLEENGFEVECMEFALNEKELSKKIIDVSVLGIRSKTHISKKVLEQAKKLQVIGAFCIGTNQIDLDFCQEKGIVVFNAPYSNSRSVVELVIGEIIMLARGVVGKSKKIHAGLWEKSAKGSFEIRGKKLGIIGYGNIGTQVSIIAQCLGMEVCFYDLEDKKPLGNAIKCRSLKDLLEMADIITINVDGRKENTNLINEKEFLLMKDGALFLNLSRGHVVNLKALANNIRSGKIMGAAIDVFDNEPEKNGEGFKTSLRGLGNVILTPHIGGSTIEAQKAIAEYVSEKIINYFRDQNVFEGISI